MCYARCDVPDPFEQLGVILLLLHQFTSHQMSMLVELYPLPQDCRVILFIVKSSSQPQPEVHYRLPDHFLLLFLERISFEQKSMRVIDTLGLPFDHSVLAINILIHFIL